MLVMLDNPSSKYNAALFETKVKIHAKDKAWYTFVYADDEFFTLLDKKGEEIRSNRIWVQR